MAMQPPKSPVLARGHTYCGPEFGRRTMVWFCAERDRLAAEDTAEQRVAKKPSRAKPKVAAVAERVQPLRAAKKRIEPANPAAGNARPRKRAKMNKQTSTPTAGEDVPEFPRGKAAEKTSQSEYTLQWPDALAAVADASDAEEQFTRSQQELLEAKIIDLMKYASWANGEPASCKWCPLLAAHPLACTNMVACFHGVGRRAEPAKPLSSPPQSRRPTPGAASAATRTRSSAPASAPEAPMEVDLEMLLWPEDALAKMTEAANEADSYEAHLSERVVDLYGLRFAVDICCGLLRLTMV